MLGVEPSFCFCVFCVLEMFLKRIKNFLIFLLQINIFLVFLNYFDVLISKIIFKK